MKRITLTPTLSKRILKDVREGIPPQVAARKAGVPLERFLDWMSRRGRRFVAFQQGIDQAQANATAENVLLLKRAAKKGRFKAAVTWLQSQAPAAFPIASARGGVNIGTLNNTGGLTLIERLKALPTDEQFDAMTAEAKAKARELVDPNSIVGQVVLMKLRRGELKDPRLEMVEEQLAARDALPPPGPENVTPDERVYEAVGFTASRPDIIDLAPVPVQ